MTINCKNGEMLNYIDYCVGNRIKMHRIFLGLSRTEVAKRIGVTVEEIDEYEQGVKEVYGSVLYLLAECLGVPMSYFFEEIDASVQQDLFEAEEFIDNLQLCVDEKEEVMPLVKAYKGILDPQDRQAVYDLIATCRRRFDSYACAI